MSQAQTTPTPRSLGIAAVGDHVLVKFSVGATLLDKKPAYRISQVRQAGPRLLRVGDQWYYRLSGKPRYKKVYSMLVEPTEENLAAWRKHRAEMQEREEKRRVDQAAWDEERHRQAKVAAEWLAKQEPGEILKHVGVQPLVDVYEYLDRERLL